MWLPLESWNRVRDSFCFFFPALDIEWGDLCDTDCPKARPFSVLIRQKTGVLLSFLHVCLLYGPSVSHSLHSPALWTSLSCSSFWKLGQSCGGLCLAYSCGQSSGSSLYDLQAWYPELSQQFWTLAFPAMKPYLSHRLVGSQNVDSWV